MADRDQRAQSGRSTDQAPGQPAADEAQQPRPQLSISREDVCFVVLKAHQFDVKDLPTVPDEGSDPPDEAMREVLEDRPDDSVREELAGFISSLTFDEQVELVALTWMGRGDGTIEDWAELRDLACSRHTKWTARYLLGIPLLGDFLEEGLAQFGFTCEDTLRRSTWLKRRACVGSKLRCACSGARVFGGKSFPFVPAKAGT